MYFYARKGDFRDVFAHLDFGGDNAVLFHRGEFVNAAEHRFARGGYKPFADAEAVNARALENHIADKVFVERI